jgi:hypothetical protein
VDRTLVVLLVLSAVLISFVAPLADTGAGLYRGVVGFFYLGFLDFCTSFG